MRISTIVFVGVLITCWALTFKWAQNMGKNNKHDDPPILLGCLPDLPPIVLPSLKTSGETASCSDDGGHGNGDDNGKDAANEEEEAEEPESEAQKETLKKIDRLKFTPLPPVPNNFNLRDVPMFTPRDSLFPKP